MTNYATLFGFGLFDSSNSKYREHLDRFVKLVQKKSIDVVVLCGGHTNPNFPERSEAGTIAEYLKPLLPSDVKVEIDDKSITTEQNIIFAKEFIDLDSANKIFVTTDAVRFFKIFWIVLDRWFGLNRKEIISTWQDIAEQIYSDPKKKGTMIELKDIRKKLKYQNVWFIVDNVHKDFRNAMHVIVSEIIEIDSLYDQELYNRTMEMAKAKFRKS